MLTATQSFKKIKESAETIKNSDRQQFSEAASVGDSFRQGDVYITKMASVPTDAKQIEPMIQVAPGNTRGSRHCLDSLQGVTMFEVSGKTEVDGPVMVVAEPRVITHPEHGDVGLCEGTYKITYQRMYAEELRRVRD